MIDSVSSSIKPLERYVLTPCEDAYPSLTGKDSLMGPLIIPNNGSVDCGVTTGIFAAVATTAQGKLDNASSAAILETRDTVAALQDHFQQTRPNGLAVSLWFQPSTNSFNVQQPILTAGSKRKSDDSEAGCSGYEILLGQFQQHLLISYTDNDPARSCRVLLVRSVTLTPNQLTHAVVIWSASETSVYIDGQPVVTGVQNAFDTTLSRWDSNASLQLLRNYQSDAVFTGSILQFSLMDQDLTSVQVSTIYNRGLVVIKPQDTPVLVAQSAANVILSQGTTHPATVQLGSATVSTMRLPLMVEILSLPRQGILTAPGQDGTLAVNSVLPLPLNTSALAIEYSLTSADYFNTPSINGHGVDLQLEPETFQFRLVTKDVTGDNIVAASSPATQSLQVIHINHRPLLNTSVQALVSPQDSNDLIVGSVELVDALDFNLDRVRIDVWSNAGQLTFNSANRPKADFSSCSDRTFSAWQCVGDGVLDRNMTFAAVPDDVASIFANLRYRSLKQGLEDFITVRVSDGSGGPCLSLQEHADYSSRLGNTLTTIHDECFQVEAVIRVPASTVTNKGDVQESRLFGIIPNSDFKNFGLADFLFWVVVASAGTAIFSYARRFFRRRAASGKAVIPDDIFYEQDLDAFCLEVSSNESILSEAMQEP